MPPPPPPDGGWRGNSRTFSTVKAEKETFQVQKFTGALICHFSALRLIF